MKESLISIAILEVERLARNEKDIIKRERYILTVLILAESRFLEFKKR
jgi:hypothetical protein